MTIRVASCSCGQARLECSAEPVRVSVCHCLDCQRRSGSAFAVQARFHGDHVKRTGATTTYVRTGGSGGKTTHHFCATCGTTVFYTADGTEAPYTPDYVAIPVGTFADPTFPTPTVSVYEERRHPWVKVLEGPDAERYD
jgi:hypothetical protein